jgi:GT2 family glycosyltransferase
LKVNIVSVAYNLPEATKKLFDTAMLDCDKHDISFQLFLHSKHQETVNMCEFLAEHYPCKYYPYGVNRGLSASWNDGMLAAYNELSADVLIVANDDIYFSEGDIDKMAKQAATHRDNYIVSVAGFHLGYNKKVVTHGYSCYALNPITIDTICCFDENIFPIYLEDVDHHRRATLGGLVETNCADTMVYHGGSSAINKDQLLARQNITTQSRSGRFYESKWGGPSHHERYKVPFNNPKFDLRIDPSVRHAPYPGHNREDQGIVRF